MLLTLMVGTGATILVMTTSSTEETAVNHIALMCSVRLSMTPIALVVTPYWFRDVSIL